MPIEKTDAVIINSTEWSDTSKIVSFYTRSHGTVKAAAKGAKRNGSPFGGTLELFYYVDIVYYEKESREIQTLSQCSVKKDFPGIKKDIVKTAYCSYFVQLTDEISGGKQKTCGLFQLLLDILSFLEENEPRCLDARFFELNLLKAAGYGPVLKKCASCGRGFAPPLDRTGFSPGAGGAVCGCCIDSHRDFLLLSGGALSTLSCLDRAGSSFLGRIQATKKIKSEIKEALDSYLEYHLEKKLKSREFLEEIIDE